MNTKFLTYVLILVGAAFIIYDQLSAVENTYALVIGLILLMFGLYRLSRGIKGSQPEQPYIVNEEEE